MKSPLFVLLQVEPGGQQTDLTCYRRTWCGDPRELWWWRAAWGDSPLYWCDSNPGRLSGAGEERSEVTGYGDECQWPEWTLLLSPWPFSTSAVWDISRSYIATSPLLKDATMWAGSQPLKSTAVGIPCSAEREVLLSYFLLRSAELIINLV